MLFVHAQACPLLCPPPAGPTDPWTGPSPHALFPRPQGLPEEYFWSGPQGQIYGLGQAWALQGQSDLAHADAAWTLLSKGATYSGEATPQSLCAFVSFGFAAHTPARLVIPEITFQKRGDKARLTLAYQAPAPSPEKLRELQQRAAQILRPATTQLPSGNLGVAGGDLEGERRNWERAVEEGLVALEAGRADKVVLARATQVRTALPAPLLGATLATRLEEAYPSCWTFLVDGLVGATPEMLVEAAAAGEQVVAHCRVLAGTASGGQGQKLWESAKDQAEHAIAADSVRQALGQVCPAVSSSQPYLLELPHLVHIATDVQAAVPPGRSLLRLAAAVHPTAAVCGQPRAAAMAIIEQVEGLDRGRYAGPVGWVDGLGQGQLGLALRCGQILPGSGGAAEGATLRLYAGAGIMPSSQPASEWLETQTKLQAMRLALDPSGAGPE